MVTPLGGDPAGRPGSDGDWGTVISVHAFGATVRLRSGRLAVASADDVRSHEGAYRRALRDRRPRRFAAAGDAGRPLVRLLEDEESVQPAAEGVPAIVDPELERKIAEYLKQTQEWELPDAPPAFERHLKRKSKRAEHFPEHPQP
ncbi:MAG TPA: hypothetical protein VNJ51_09775 [Candidatus Dormibacteraeota bacterium]|nr:hypothetical protein [Candidatus Dormibacteraeota bacterium]